MKGCYTLDDMREKARRLLPRPVFDYVDGAADDEVTARANRDDFTAWRLRLRAGVDTGTPQTQTTVLGTAVSAPVLFAPCGLTGIVHPDGELAVARAAAELGTIAIFSSFSTHSLEAIAQASTGPKWFQLYFLGGRAGAWSMIDRADQAGYDALVITLDTPVTGNRERDLRNAVQHPVTRSARDLRRYLPSMVRRPRWSLRFALGGAPVGLGNVVGAGSGSADDHTQAMFTAPPTWDDVAHIRDRWKRRLVVKGVLEANDVRRAVELGADAVIVSNHGGRQLDTVPSTIEVLAEAVDAAATHIEVLIDGGFRRGTDVIVARSLGATAVCIGRPYLYGLALGGQQGVAHAWNLIVTELRRNLILMGCSDVAHLDHDSVRRAGGIR